ncbi:MAG: hypothetical protein JKY52_20720 [Flavobacteriales bacterium]|nr:hypothetical protein [Flavobacteriales bacterium]
MQLLAILGLICACHTAFCQIEYVLDPDEFIVVRVKFDSLLQTGKVTCGTDENGNRRKVNLHRVSIDSILYVADSTSKIQFQNVDQIVLTAGLSVPIDTQLICICSLSCSYDFLGLSTILELEPKSVTFKHRGGYFSDIEYCYRRNLLGKLFGLNNGKERKKIKCEIR